MSNESASDGACYAQNVPRKSIAFLMPETSMAPFVEDVIQATVRQIAKRLRLDSLMVESHTFSMGVHVLCLFHGNAPLQSVSTFNKEKRRPQRLRYTPNKKLMLIFDPIGGLFYVAAQLEDIQRLLMALNGTLFPNRAFDAPFKILAVRLDQLQSVARGAHASKTYHAVTLKSLSGCDFGYNATRAKLDWAEDGFKAIELSANKWPPHAEEARLLIHVNEYKKPFTLTIYEGTGVIKAALSEKTFWAIAEVLRRCTGNYTEHYEVALPIALQREMDFTQSPALTRLKEVDNTPYIATEEEIPIECEAAPIKFKCSCTPYGRHSLKCCPYSQIDALQVAQTYRNDKSVHCVLFSVPKGASKIDPDGIVAWAEEASKFVSKPIHAYEPGQKFPCGNAPYCKQHAETEEQEDQEKLKHLIDIYGTYSSNVKNGFKGLKHKALLTIHLWSSEEDPEKKGHPISIPSLADIFEVTPDAIYYTLRKAKKVNAKLYKKMENERNKRAEETHGYIVDERTAARDADD